MKKRNRVLATLSNDQLIRKGDRAVRCRHELAIEILDCLIEIERRSLHLEEGYSSLFDYCTRRWRYSPPKACRTIAVARCIQNFPAVRSLLVEQKITVCGVARIAGILTDENCEKLLREVSGKKYIEIEKIVASKRRAPRIREFVRPIGVMVTTDREKKAGNNDLFRATEEAAAGMAGRTANHLQFEGKWQTDQPARSMTGTDPRPVSIEEKPESRYEIRFSASEGFLRKLKRAQAICSRRPGLEAVLEKALDELLDRHDPDHREARREKRKSARRDRSEPSGSSGAPRTPGTTPDKRSRHIPASIRDAVFRRDDGRCTYIGRNDVRCGATAHLQIDHIRPFCRGGKHTIDNLRLLCGKHNRLAARNLSLLI